MVDWQKSMSQSFEYYVVDSKTWQDKTAIDKVTSCVIERDDEESTLGSASFEISESFEECYIRVYLIAIQNGFTDKRVLGTFLVQSPSEKFDGKRSNISADGYTSLLELKESGPPLGYTVTHGQNTVDIAARLTREKVRAPVVPAKNAHSLFNDFISDIRDTWLSFISDLLANAKFAFDVDEMGRILFAPEQDTASLQPVWTYTDDNSSILYPEVTIDRDFYEIPNVVEVYYSNNAGYYYARVVNDDPNSPTSTVSREREIVYRVTDPELAGAATQRQIDEYAKQLLRNLSALEYRITYTHGYCPVRTRDCVRLNYTRAGLTNIKAKVVSQTIQCKTGCVVTETAVFTKKLWG